MIDVLPVILAACQTLAGEADRIMQFLLRQFGQVLGDTDSTVVRPQERDVFVRVVRTQDQSEERFFAGLHAMLREPAQVQFHLPFVGGLELSQLEINRHQTPQAAMVEQQVEVVVLVVDGDPFLPGDEVEVGPHHPG